ncbi:protein TonB [Allopseudospirillum japonicum]|uniref:Protein TonB n=1 Tax=Allopseudospirillum japonicum TaxID=64971 RepID=A0A1H6U070_9GAMM|nr:energy transducer TonB [Allopseudospirillum japonicum]SEI81845.1 protein TonB [Allopseudospirillum japonicum]
MISAPGRLLLALCTALAVHLLLAAALESSWLGIDPMPKPPRSTLDVVLFERPQTSPAPEQATWLANQDRQASGTQETPNPEVAQAPPQAQTAATTSITEPQTTTEKQPTPVPPKLQVKSSPSPQVIQTEAPEPKTLTAEATFETKTLDPQALLAQLEAELAAQQAIYAQRPRVRTLSSTATMTSPEAFYLETWRKRVEQIGNLNYPQAARTQKLQGQLRLLVAVRKDGSVQEILVLESSGHPVLDQAAQRIVMLAAPFAPFPDELKTQVDVLEIIRTWRFGEDRWHDKS